VLKARQATAEAADEPIFLIKGVRECCYIACHPPAPAQASTSVPQYLISRVTFPRSRGLREESRVVSVAADEELGTATHGPMMVAGPTFI
jgi:hypothetical protein